MQCVMLVRMWGKDVRSYGKRNFAERNWRAELLESGYLELYV